MVPQALGKKILELRCKQGLTQAQLAKGICDRSHISMIEAGRSTPSFRILEQIAARLKIAITDLLGDIVTPSREVSFSFTILLGHLETLLSSKQYLDGCVVIRKHLRHPDIAKAPCKLSQLYRYSGIFEAMLQNYERSATNLQRALEQAQTSRDVHLILEALVSLGALHNTLGQYEQAERFYREALEQPPKEVPFEIQVKTQLGLGMALQGQDKFRPALRVLAQTFTDVQKQKSLFLAGELASSIGLCHQLMAQYEEALPYHQKAATYFTLSENKFETSNSYMNIALCHRELKQHDQFRQYMARANDMGRVEVSPTGARPAELLLAAY
jgi:HTH-type transcriptional regulator, quorum sensing regulator NprR